MPSTAEAPTAPGASQPILAEGDLGPASIATSTAARAQELLTRVVAAKAGAEPRPGQQQMVDAVACALAQRVPLLIEAPTGVGKSYGYLTAAAAHLHGDTPSAAGAVVIATATKALQEQLIDTDLPFLAEQARAAGHPFTYAMLKGRSNYVCRARLAEHVGDQEVGAGVMTSADGAVIADRSTTRRVRAWAASTDTGDRAELDLPDPVWRELTVSGEECPGRARCALSDRCFAYAARDRAAEADIVVVNTALYGAHLAADGQLLSSHDAVIFDEAHTLEASLSDAFSVTLTPGRLRHLAHTYRRVVTSQPSGPDTDHGDNTATRLLETAEHVEQSLRLEADARPDRPDLRGDLGVLLRRAKDLTAQISREAEALTETLAEGATTTRAGAAAATRVSGLASSATKLSAELAALLDPANAGPVAVTWVENAPSGPRLRRAPVDIGPVLAEKLFPEVTVIATSATLTVAGSFTPVTTRWGLHLPAPDGHRPRAGTARVASPFDYPRQGMLYVAGHLPDPRQDRYAPSMHAELAQLAQAADGRTLALFTSRAGMNAAAAHLRSTTDLTVLCQGEGSRAGLLTQFTSGPGHVLCALASFWTGVDIPGADLTLVTIDKIPFPRRDDPLVNARRSAASRNGGSGFHDIDIPAAATELAQGVGRLIRTVSDKGAVAIFDSRLLTKSYGRLLLDSLPDLYPTRHLEQVTQALIRLTATPGQP